MAFRTVDPVAATPQLTYPSPNSAPYWSSAAFVGGTAAFRETLGIGPVRWRLWTAAFAAATIPLGGLVSIEAQISLVTAGLAVLLVLEGRDGACAGGPRSGKVGLTWQRQPGQ